MWMVLGVFGKRTRDSSNRRDTTGRSLPPKSSPPVPALIFPSQAHPAWNMGREDVYFIVPTRILLRVKGDTIHDLGTAGIKGLTLANQGVTQHLGFGKT